MERLFSMKYFDEGREKNWGSLPSHWCFVNENSWEWSEGESFPRSPAQLGVWWNYAGGCTVTSGQAGSCHSHFTLNNRALNTEHRYVHTKTATKGVADVDTDDDVDVYAITWTQSDWTVDTSPWGNTFSTQYLIFVTDQFHWTVDMPWPDHRLVDTEPAPALQVFVLVTTLTRNSIKKVRSESEHNTNLTHRAETGSHYNSTRQQTAMKSQDFQSMSEL